MFKLSWAVDDEADVGSIFAGGVSSFFSSASSSSSEAAGLLFSSGSNRTSR